MLKPVITPEIRKAQWGDDQESVAWFATLCVKPGGLCWRDRLENCRIFLIRRDFGRLDSPPEGIWLKWIEDGEQKDSLTIAMERGKKYETAIVVRNWRDSSAYIANERFIESLGAEKKWELPSGRICPRDKNGRFTFWLEIRVGRKAYRSEHFYALMVPPAGTTNNEFTLNVLYDPVREL